MEAEIFPLFSVPVFKSKVNDLDFDDLNQRLDSLEYEKTANGDGWMSVQQSLLYQEEFVDVKEQVERYLKGYLHQVLNVSTNHNLKHVCSWAIYHDIRNWCFPHLHTNSLFSGVLYTNVPENSGESLTFGHAQLMPTWCSPTMEPTVTDYNLYNSKTWGFDVQRGDILLFPSHVLHNTPVSKTTEKRRCIAFNYFLTGKFGLKTAYAEF